MVLVEETMLETPTIKTLVFNDKLSSRAGAGQFLMVWIPKIDEVPMSIMIFPTKHYAAVTVRKYGFGTTALFEMKSGDRIGIRGPYGNKFAFSDKFRHVLLVGGGTGLVPLLRLASQLTETNIRCTLIMGARNQNEVFFDRNAYNMLGKTRNKVIVCTDDGSCGIKGTTVDVMANIVNEYTFDQVFTCGPEKMMKKIFEICQSNMLPIQASLERYMKCGIGICGSCSIDKCLVCTDGPVFNGSELLDMKEFGQYFRDKFGELKKIS
jgi:dihydroorotate dehydrogenase electron transfer subunit